MIDRKLQEKWEKRLERHGLGIDQPMTDNSDGELEQAESIPSARGEKHPDHARLRAQIDSNDLFMEGGFGIKSIRSLEREIPKWALSNKEVQRVINTAFPLAKTSLLSRKPKGPDKKRIAKAGRWVRIIQLYYRMGLPLQIVAKEMKMTEAVLKITLRNIGRAEAGLRANGSGLRSRKSATPPTPREGQERKGNETK